MASSKIIAYFMHEHEDAAIQQNITNLRRTDSFIIGDATDEQVERLKNDGIIYEVLEENPKKKTTIQDFEVLKSVTLGLAGTPDFDGVDGFRNIAAPSPLQIRDEEAAAGFPAYYKFTTLGPLLDEDRVALSKEEILVTEFIPPNIYVVRINNQDQYDRLSLFDFTRTIEFYSSNDTGVHTSLKMADGMPAEVKGQDILTFDLLVKTELDMATLLDWFKTNNILVAGAAGMKARIYLMRDSPLIRQVGAHPLIVQMNEYIKPKLHNDAAAVIIGTDLLTPIPAGAQTCFEGEGQIVGVADTGIDVNHPDLAAQLIGTSALGRAGNVTDTAGHGTHVAGTIAGDGSASGGALKGIAPKAKLYFQSLLNASDELSLPLLLSDLFDEAYKQGARIHNNSWGSSTESKYTVNSTEVDDYVYRNKDMLLVFSAGNDGNAIRYGNVPKGFVDFLTIGSPASAKNVLTVGASRSSRSAAGFSTYTYAKIWPKMFPYPPYYDVQLISGDAESLAGFSSRGPCDDDRIKPDVVAPGTDIASTKSALAAVGNFWGIYPGNAQYALMGGTSMAAPVVSGFAALVREYFVKVKGVVPSAALMKATIINGCKKLTGVDAVLKYADLPNFNQGFGRVDAVRTIPDANHDFFFYFVDNYNDPAEQFQKTGQRLRLKFTVNTPGCWLRVCLAYTDVPARALQNNLNLMMDCLTQKWVGNGNAASLLKSLDSKNNVEVIVIDDAPVGVYTLQVVCSNLIKGPQDFALVMTSSDQAITTPFDY